MGRGLAGLQAPPMAISGAGEHIKSRVVFQKRSRPRSGAARPRRAPLPTARPAVRRGLHVEAAGRGQRFSPDDVQVSTSIGSGSFGEVFKARGVHEAGWGLPACAWPSAPSSAGQPGHCRRWGLPGRRRALLPPPQGVVRTGGREELVILKRVKARVQGAAEMAEMEHAINVSTRGHGVPAAGAAPRSCWSRLPCQRCSWQPQGTHAPSAAPPPPPPLPLFFLFLPLLQVYASKAASRAVADFLGFLEVEEAQGRLTRGLWLVWRYQVRRWRWRRCPPSTFMRACAPPPARPPARPRAGRQDSGLLPEAPRLRRRAGRRPWRARGGGGAHRYAPAV